MLVLGFGWGRGGESGTYGCVVAAEALVGSWRGAAEHHHDFDAAGLQLGDFGPERVVHGVAGVVVVEGDVAGLLVEVDGGEENVGHAGVFLE